MSVVTVFLPSHEDTPRSVTKVAGVGSSPIQQSSLFPALHARALQVDHRDQLLFFKASCLLDCLKQAATAIQKASAKSASKHSYLHGRISRHRERPCQHFHAKLINLVLQVANLLHGRC